MQIFIVAVISGAMGAIIAMYLMVRSTQNRIMRLIETTCKDDRLLKTYHQWLHIRNNKKSVASYLKACGFCRVAIYGMHYLGESLCEELKNNGIQIVYGIDRNADKITSDFKIISPVANMEEVDAVIVTAVYYYDEIEEMLDKKLKCPILSLEDIVFDC